MLREAFEAKQRMNPHIAEETPIEAMLDAAAAAGATGGKICGAGGGGYLLIATPPEARASVRAALEAMGASSPPSRSTPRACEHGAATTTGRPRVRDPLARVRPALRAARPRRHDQRGGRPPR
jgi:hypothetical protein